MGQVGYGTHSLETPARGGRASSDPAFTHPLTNPLLTPFMRRASPSQRWFVIEEGSDTLVYYKDPPQVSNRKHALGALGLLGCTIERIGGGDGTFQVHTKERVLTLRAESEADMRRWVLAFEASGGIAEFDVESKKRPSLCKKSDGSLSEHSGGSDAGSSGKPKVRPSVTWSSVDKSCRWSTASTQ